MSKVLRFLSSRNTKPADISPLSLLQEYLKPLVAQKGDRSPRDAPELSVLFHCVSVSLTLLSPIMPFITEELWQRLEPWRPAAAAQDSLCLQPYPSPSQLVPLHCCSASMLTASTVTVIYQSSPTPNFQCRYQAISTDTNICAIGINTL